MQDKLEQKELTAIDVTFKVHSHRIIRFFIPTEELENKINNAIKDGIIKDRKEFSDYLHEILDLDKLASNKIYEEVDEQLIEEVLEIAKTNTGEVAE